MSTEICSAFTDKKEINEAAADLAAQFGDIDPVAVRVARENIAMNRVEDTVTVTEADLLHGHSGEGYDLVVANIIADIIVRLVPDLPRVLKA